MGSGELVKAEIRVQDSGPEGIAKLNGQSLTVCFNPREYVLTKVAPWVEHQIQMYLLSMEPLWMEPLQVTQMLVTFSGFKIIVMVSYFLMVLLEAALLKELYGILVLYLIK